MTFISIIFLKILALYYYYYYYYFVHDGSNAERRGQWTTRPLGIKDGAGLNLYAEIVFLVQVCCGFT
jgi:hypothetical protein